jgi:hypothetical protein
MFFCDTEIPHTCVNEMTILIWIPTKCVNKIIRNTDYTALTEDSIQQEAGCINSTEFHIQLSVYWLYQFLGKILLQWNTLALTTEEMELTLKDPQDYMGISTS